MKCAIRRRVLPLVACGVLALVAFVAPVAAGSSRLRSEVVSPAAWSVPVRALAGHFDQLSEVIDSQDHVHIAVTGQDDLWYVTNRTGSWTHKRVLSHTSSYTYGMPSIAIDENDRVHIAVERLPNGQGDMGIWYVTDKGRTRGTFPSSPKRIAPASIGEPVLKVSNGHLFLVAVSGWCCAGDGTLQLRTNVTGHWTVSTIGRGSEPSFRLGSDNRARVAYARGDEAVGLYYATAASPSGGFTTNRIAGTTSRDVGPILGLDGANRPRIAWQHYNGTSLDVLYSWRGPSGWHAPVTVAAGQPEGDAIGFDTDTQNRPNVAIGGASLHVRVLSGGTWHASTVTSTSDVADLVLRRASHGHAVVAWTDQGGGVWVSRN